RLQSLYKALSTHRRAWLMILLVTSGVLLACLALYVLAPPYLTEESRYIQGFLGTIGGLTGLAGGLAGLIAFVSWFFKRNVEYALKSDLETTKHKLAEERDENKRKWDKDLEDLRNSQLSERDAIKHERTKVLEELRDSQRKALAQTRAAAEERLEHIKAALIRVERLEADLVKSRGEGYGAIWKLTGSLNLFGPETELDCKKFSDS